MRQGWTDADYEKVLKKHGQAGVAQTAEQRFRKPPVAGSTPVTSSKFKSKLEAAFSNKLELEKRTGFIQDYWYEPFSFKLANGKRYRVDWLRWNADGSTDCLETKGHHKNLRDSLTHLAWAAQRFPFHRWFKVRWIDGQWEEREIR